VKRPVGCKVESARGERRGEFSEAGSEKKRRGKKASQSVTEEDSLLDAGKEKLP